MENIPLANDANEVPEDDTRRKFLKGVGIAGASMLLGSQSEAADAEYKRRFDAADWKRMPIPPMRQGLYSGLEVSKKISTLERFHINLSDRILAEQEILKQVEDEMAKLGVKK